MDSLGSNCSWNGLFLHVVVGQPPSLVDGLLQARHDGMLDQHVGAGLGQSRRREQAGVVQLRDRLSIGLADLSERSLSLICQSEDQMK